MNFFMLKKLRDNLSKKNDRNREEEELLQELFALGKILDETDFSLSLSNQVCKACGRPFK